jgi:hypothetical protein
MTDDEYAAGDPYAMTRPTWLTADEQWAEKALEWAEDRRKCRMGRNCPAPTEFVVAWMYITGRAGRASWSEKPVCPDHARSFAEKNNASQFDEVDGRLVPVGASADTPSTAEKRGSSPSEEDSAT